MKLTKLKLASLFTALCMVLMLVTDTPTNIVASGAVSTSCVSSVPDGIEEILAEADISKVGDFTDRYSHDTWIQIEGVDETVMSKSNVYVKITMSNMGDCLTGEKGDIITPFDTLVAWGWDNYSGWVRICSWYNNDKEDPSGNFKVDFAPIEASKSNKTVAYSPISNFNRTSWGGIAGNIQNGAFAPAKLESVQLVEFSTDTTEYTATTYEPDKKEANGNGGFNAFFTGSWDLKEAVGPKARVEFTFEGTPDGFALCDGNKAEWWSFQKLTSSDGSKTSFTIDEIQNAGFSEPLKIVVNGWGTTEPNGMIVYTGGDALYTPSVKPNPDDQTWTKTGKGKYAFASIDDPDTSDKVYGSGEIAPEDEIISLDDLLPEGAKPEDIRKISISADVNGWKSADGEIFIKAFKDDGTSEDSSVTWKAESKEGEPASVTATLETPYGVDSDELTLKTYYINYGTIVNVKITVEVKEPSVSLAETTTVKTGEDKDIALKITDADGYTFTAASSDTKTAAVTLAGDNSKITVTGVAKGSATITVTGKKEGADDITATCKVTVECAHSETTFVPDKTDPSKGHYKKCDTCGELIGEIADHTMEKAADSAEAATCTEAGKEADEKCKVCGYEKEGAVISAKGHTKGEAKRENEVKATCTAAGSYDEVIRCTVCEALISKTTKTIDKLDHVMEVVSGTAKVPTCVKEGKEADKKCKNCDYTETGAVIPATGKHTSGTPERKNEKPATCTVGGSYDEVTKCTVCEEVLKTEKKTTDALGHNAGTKLIQGDTTHYYECTRCNEKIKEEKHTEDKGTVTTNPTATTDGERTYKCSVCGKALRTETIPALGEDHKHEFTITNSDSDSHWKECACGEKSDITAHTKGTKEEIIKNATCSEDGQKIVITSCTECNKELSREIVSITKAEHSLTAHSAVAATCTTAGNEAYWTCDACKKIFADKDGAKEIEAVPTISALGHKLTAHSAAAATCTKDGNEAYWTCDTCEKMFADEKGASEIKALPTISALGHDYQNVEGSGKEPTCVTDGNKPDQECSRCGDTIKGETLSATGEHTFNNGVCTVCGEKDPDYTPSTPDTPSSNISVEVKTDPDAPHAEIKTSVDLLKQLLTADEQELFKNGTDVKIMLTVNTANVNIPEADKSLIETAVSSLSGFKVGQYLDINLLKIVGGSESKITNTGDPITISVEIPATLRKGDREFVMIRVHDGKTEVLTDMDNDPNTITVQTDKFSTYSIAYMDESNPNPPTGGTSRRPLYMALGAASLLTFAFLCIFGKKNGKQDMYMR